MEYGTFALAWDEPRRPLADEGLDAERRGRYWEWSNRLSGLQDDARRIGAARDGRGWHVLGNARQADYEAFHMQHSVGYNWDHYSSIGPIYSLRDKDNVPSVTILVCDGTVVHARRAENAPLEPADLLAVRELALEQGWAVLDPERL